MSCPPKKKAPSTPVGSECMARIGMCLDDDGSRLSSAYSTIMKAANPPPTTPDNTRPLIPTQEKNSGKRKRADTNGLVSTIASQESQFQQPFQNSVEQCMPQSPPTPMHAKRPDLYYASAGSSAVSSNVDGAYCDSPTSSSELSVGHDDIPLRYLSTQIPENQQPRFVGYMKNTSYNLTNAVSPNRISGPWGFQHAPHTYVVAASHGPPAHQQQQQQQQQPCLDPISPQAAIIPQNLSSIRAHPNRNTPQLIPSESFFGSVETTCDAFLLFEAARNNIVPRITRRLTEKEKKSLRSGSVCIFDEREAQIKRWTDGRLWTPSRIMGNFLIYRELDKKLLPNTEGVKELEMLTKTGGIPEGRVYGSHKGVFFVKPNGLLKKTISLVVPDNPQAQKINIGASSSPVVSNEIPIPGRDGANVCIPSDPFTADIIRNGSQPTRHYQHLIAYFRPQGTCTLCISIYLKPHSLTSLRL